MTPSPAKKPARVAQEQPLTIDVPCPPTIGQLGMSVIGVTRLRVQSIRYLPAFAMHFLRTRKQVR